MLCPDMTAKHQQLLRDLKTTVENLLASQVANVWYVYGGLNRLHNAVEKIFRNGCKTTESKYSDYWSFIQGLEWLQPNTSMSTFSIDCEYKTHIPQYIRNDKASIWLYKCLENHSLSQKLSWLLSDKSHVLSCYQEQAYLCQERYSEAMLICLRAVERNQPSLLSEIEPSLFLSKTSVKDYHRIHRRCSSFPDAHLQNLSQNNCTRSKTLHSMAVCEEEQLKKIIKKKRKMQGKLKAWSSMPDLNLKDMKIRERSKSCVQSRTTPSTPIHKRENNFRRIENKFIKIPLELKRTNFLVDNCDIIEYTPPKKSLLESFKASSPETGKSLPDYNFLDALSGVSGQKDYRKQPKKSFIEDGGMSVLPMATGYFPRPTKGQTLTSFLTSSQFTRANAELDRENAHFSISEAMIAAMEQIKCKRDLNLADEQVEESDEEIMDLKQRIRMRRRQKIEEKQRKMWGSFETSLKKDTSSSETPQSSNSSEEIEDLEIDEACNLVDNRHMSMSMASLYSEADLRKRTRGAPDGASDVLSAEGVALSLISRFNEKHLPRASELEWLISEEEVPQALLPLPKSWPINPDEGEEIPVTPLRGTTEWAPPRPQIIFTLHPCPVKKEILEKQNYRCAGCGCRVEKKYSSTFRYCNYLGRYFCTQCHTNQLGLIPARILQKWDFKRYTVSNFSYRLLDQMCTDPLFRVFDLNKNIEKRSKNLLLCRKYRLGLFHMKDFIQTCRFAETIQECLQNEPSYIYTDPEVYSLQDLVNVRSGNMKSRLKYLIEMCCRHIYECHLCTARGFVCEICKEESVIFPWQFKIVSRCSKCGNCFHSKCWKSESPCLRCNRIDERKKDQF